jgi:ubiquinone/menaquinone biosynthesis C-methylase UbiE
VRSQVSVLAVLALAACAGKSSQPVPASGSDSFEGRTIAQTMSFRGADWLDRPDRADREQPDKVLDALGITEGETVADVGAGTGYFTVRLARRVGLRGTVYATDLQPEMLRMLDARVTKEGLRNVQLVRAGDHETGLPDACCDLILMVDVYHELSDPQAILASLRHALKRSGRLVLVEYRGEDAAVAIKPEHKMTLVQIKREVGARGFHYLDSLEFLPDQRVVIFTRDDA